MNSPGTEEPRQIRIDQFNAAMFADHNDKKNFWKVMKAWWAFFLCRDPEYFRKNTEVKTYLDYIKNENPDIAYVTEVCGKEQRDALIQWFTDMGYYVHSVPWFELWSMHEDSHKFLYHITASKFPFEQMGHFKQYTNDKAVRVLKQAGNIPMRVLKSVLWLWKPLPFIPPTNPTEDVKEKVQGILDGSGSHLRVKVGENTHLDLCVLHVQTQTSDQVLEELAESSSKNDPENNNMRILLGDFNAEVAATEGIVKTKDPRLVRLATDETYPKVFADDQGWWLAGMVNRLAKRFCFRHPDQIFTNQPSNVTNIDIRWPKKQDLGLTIHITAIP